MNEFYTKFLNTTHDRQGAFKKALDAISHIENPSILEIGASRSTNPEDIYGDGFADISWCHYLLNKGKGSLTIVEIDPDALNNCKNILSDFIDKVDIKFICDDGLNWLNNDWSMVYLDGDDNPISMIEQFEEIDRENTLILCDDFHGKGVILRNVYADFELIKANYLHELAIYHPTSVKSNQNYYIINNSNKQEWQVFEEFKALDLRNHTVFVENNQLAARVKAYYPNYESSFNYLIYKQLDSYGDDTFKIGNLELDYIRESANLARRNERSVELGLAKWFAEKYNNDIIELGAVCCQYSFFKEWSVIDPYDETYPNAIKKDILDADYKGKSVVGISTVEHCGIDVGYQQPIILDLAARGLQKIVDESANYLISFPIGANRNLEEYVKNSDLSYFFMTRDNKRDEINNWSYNKDINHFDDNYLHFEFNLDYYGSAHSVCFVTNQKELL